MDQYDECASYSRELASIVDALLQKPDLGELQSSLHRWSKIMMTLLENSLGNKEFPPLHNNNSLQLQLHTPWRILMQKVPEAFASLTDLINGALLHDSPFAALENLQNRVRYYTIAAELLASDLERRNSRATSSVFHPVYPLGKQHAKDTADLRTWIRKSFDVSSPENLFDLRYSKSGENQKVTLGQDDWPTPKGQASLCLRSIICRETEVAAMSSSNEHLDVKLRIAVFALAKLRTALQHPPPKPWTLAYGIDVLSTAHACALTILDVMRLASTPPTPAECIPFLCLLLEHGMIELRRFDQQALTPLVPGTPQPYSYVVKDPLSETMVVAPSSSALQNPCYHAQDDKVSGSISHRGRNAGQETLTTSRHGPQNVALTAQQSFDTTLPVGEEKEIHGEGPIILRVAKHDPSKLLRELVWSQAMIRVFASRGEPQRKYRIAFYRDDFLITNYYVTPGIDALVLGYAFNVKPPALWFLVEGQTNYCFSSCSETFYEDLLIFQEIFMENIPSHYPLVDSFAFFDGGSKILEVSNPTVQIWAADSAPSLASSSASSSASQLPGSRNILRTRPSQVARILIFALESIFVLSVSDQTTLDSPRSLQEVLIATDSKDQRFSFYRLDSSNGCLPGLNVTCSMSDLQQSLSSMKKVSTKLKLQLPNTPTCADLTSKLRDCINSSQSAAHKVQKDQELQRNLIIESSSRFDYHV